MKHPRRYEFSREHRQPFKGAVRYGRDSGIRKLARAMRRGTLGSEHLRVIHESHREADRRWYIYLNRKSAPYALHA